MVEPVTQKNQDVLCKLTSEGMSHGELRQKAFELFGQKWGTSYNVDEEARIIKHFPRGVIELQV